MNKQYNTGLSFEAGLLILNTISDNRLLTLTNTYKPLNVNCMNKICLGVLIGLALTLLKASGVKPASDVKNSTAEVNQIEGLLIFTDSKPIREYEYLGTVKSNTGGFGNPQYEGVRGRLIKKAKADYPKADGVIMYLNYGQADKADAIRFK
jgi:hypothetical protein